MSDLYDKIREDVAFRSKWAVKLGLGFEIRPKISSKSELLEGMDGNTRSSFRCNYLILGISGAP